MVRYEVRRCIRKTVWIFVCRDVVKVAHKKFIKTMTTKFAACSTESETQIATNKQLHILSTVVNNDSHSVRE